MKNDGKLYLGNTVVGNVTVDGVYWDVTLDGKDFDGLSARDDDGNPYHYYIDKVVEANVPDGMTPSIDNDVEDATEYKRLYSEEDLETDKKLSVTNRIVIADKEITVVKVIEGTTTPLAGAKFVLTRVDENGHEMTDPDDAYTSGEISVDSVTGSITFGSLKPGYYKLEETKVPSGYIKNEGLYYFHVENDGLVSIDEKLTVAHTMISATGGSSFKIENEPGSALPNAGGLGTTHIYLLGVTLMGIAGASLVMERRKRAA